MKKTILIEDATEVLGSFAGFGKSKNMNATLFGRPLQRDEKAGNDGSKDRAQLKNSVFLHFETEDPRKIEKNMSRSHRTCPQSPKLQMHLIAGA